MARLLERGGRAGPRAAFLRLLLSFECLASWPTRYLTGYFVAVRAVRR
jgi:hypothetical protein